MRQFWERFGLAVLLGVAAQGAAAVTFIDLVTTGSTATINGAIFAIPTAKVDATGTGVVDAFIQIQDSPNEEGYNSSDRAKSPAVQFDETTTLQHNHDLTILDLSTNKVTVGGIQYYEFVLDTFESTGGQGGVNRFLSLDKLEFFLAPTGTNTTTCGTSGGFGYVSGPSDPPPAGGPLVPSGTLCGLQAVYSLDGLTTGTADDYSIRLNSALYPGSGGGIDMIVLVPTALFGTTATDKVYLYSRFGDFQNTDATFEEWARKSTGTFTVPVPGTIALLGLGLLGLMLSRSRRC